MRIILWAVLRAAASSLLALCVRTAPCLLVRGAGAVDGISRWGLWSAGGGQPLEPTPAERSCAQALSASRSHRFDYFGGFRLWSFLFSEPLGLTLNLKVKLYKPDFYRSEVLEERSAWESSSRWFNFAFFFLPPPPRATLFRSCKMQTATFTWTVTLTHSLAHSRKVARVLLWDFYLCAAVLASKIPAPCIHERTGVMPVGSGSSFMVRAPRGRLSWMENIKVSFWELCLHQKHERRRRRRRIILPVPATQKAKGPPGLRWRKEEEGGEEEGWGGGAHERASELPQSTGSWSREEPRIPVGVSGVVLDPSPDSQQSGFKAAPVWS